MAKFFLQNAYIFVLLNYCVDFGDGRWKKTAKEALKYDIKLYRKLSDKLNRELAAIYEENSNDNFFNYYLDEINNLHEKLNHNLDSQRNNIVYNKTSNPSLNIKEQNDLKNKTIVRTLSTRFGLKSSMHKWPKFEDILLAMGKKYDWKNDRWIKIKKKTKDQVENEINFKKSSRAITVKHKFIYKIVKLNRAKSKRNIVIAVTAVR